MKKYLYILEGGADGCDDYIGCNRTYGFMEAASYKEATEQILGKTLEKYESVLSLDENYGVTEIQVFEITNESVIDLKPIGIKEAQDKKREEIRRKYESAKKLVQDYEGE